MNTLKLASQQQRNLKLPHGYVKLRHNKCTLSFNLNRSNSQIGFDPQIREVRKITILEITRIAEKSQNLLRIIRDIELTKKKAENGEGG